MAQCELCGRKDSKFNVEIEGTNMKVCEDCSKFGKVTGKTNVNILIKENKKIEHKEPTFIFLPGYGGKVKNAREKLGLKQEDFAKKLNLRESLLHQIESEHFKPDVDAAHKLERELHIKIMEEIKEDEENELNRSSHSIHPVKSGPLTLGDMIQVKKKKS